MDSEEWTNTITITNITLLNVLRTKSTLQQSEILDSLKISVHDTTVATVSREILAGTWEEIENRLEVF